MRSQYKTEEWLFQTGCRTLPCRHATLTTPHLSHSHRQILRQSELEEKRAKVAASLGPSSRLLSDRRVMAA